MRSRKKRVGHITVPKGATALPHEFVVATILSWTGDDVEFLPVRHSRTADIIYQGLEWEIKSPIGQSSRTIENNLRNAIKQSRNVIIDLRRTKRSDKQAIKEIENQIKLNRGANHIKVITKNKEVITLL